MAKATHELTADQLHDLVLGLGMLINSVDREHALSTSQRNKKKAPLRELRSQFITSIARLEEVGTIRTREEDSAKLRQTFGLEDLG